MPNPGLQGSMVKGVNILLLPFFFFFAPKNHILNEFSKLREFRCWTTRQTNKLNPSTPETGMYYSYSQLEIILLGPVPAKSPESLLEVESLCWGDSAVGKMLAV